MNWKKAKFFSRSPPPPHKFCTPEDFKSGLTELAEFELISRTVASVSNGPNPLRRESFLDLLNKALRAQLPGYIEYTDNQVETQAALELFYRWKIFLRVVKAMKLKCDMDECRFELLKHQLPQMEGFSFAEFQELFSIAKNCEV